MFLKSLLLFSSIAALGCAAPTSDAEDCSGDRCDEGNPSTCETTAGIEDLGEVHDSEESSTTASFSQVPGWADHWTVSVIDDSTIGNPTVRIQVIGNREATLGRIHKIRATALCEGAVVECLKGDPNSENTGCVYEKGTGGSNILEFEVDCDGLDDSSTISVFVESGREDRGERYPLTCMTYDLDVLVN